MAVHCLELGYIGFYITSDLEISLAPRDVPWASPSGHLSGLGKSLGRQGCTTQYIPPLSSVRIQYLIIFGSKGTGAHWREEGRLGASTDARCAWSQEVLQEERQGGASQILPGAFSWNFPNLGFCFSTLFVSDWHSGGQRCRLLHRQGAEQGKEVHHGGWAPGWRWV